MDEGVGDGVGVRVAVGGVVGVAEGGVVEVLAAEGDGVGVGVWAKARFAVADKANIPIKNTPSRIMESLRGSVASV